MSEPQDLIEIVVPCYNPLPGWHTNLINSFRKFEDSIGKNCALILVNDGSAKGVEAKHIEEISSEIGRFRYVTYPENKGKGFALRKGVAETSGNTIILTDIDFPYINESMLRIEESLEQGNDLSLGYREASYYRKVPFVRLLISRAFRFALQSFLNMNADDTQCGLKGLNARGRKIFLQTRTNGYLYDLEFVKNAKKAGLSIDRTVVELKDGVEFTNMKPSILWKEARNFIRILFN